MVRVNLIGKKRKQKRNQNWIFVGLIAMYSAFVLYFVIESLYVVISLSSLNNSLANVEQDTQTVSRQMLSNNEFLSKFVLSKFILTKIQTLNKNKFRYKDYLDQIAGMLPPNADLKNVDFSVPGWISVLISAQDLKTLKQLEDLLSNSNQLNSTMFSSVFSENVSKDKTGVYNMKLQFELRKNGGK